MDKSTLIESYAKIDWSFVYPNNSYVELSMKDFTTMKSLAEMAIDSSPRWAVMIGIAPKFESYEPLALGRDDEPEPSMLLRRNRIQAFSSREQAENELKKTIEIGRENKSPWVKWRFKIVEVV